MTVTVADDVATYLNNKKRREMARLEETSDISVQVLGLEHVSPEHLLIECHDATGREVKMTLA